MLSYNSKEKLLNQEGTIFDVESLNTEFICII